MKYKARIRVLAAYYFLIAALFWLVLGLFSLIEGEIQISGTIEDGTDVLFMLMIWILPYVLGIYFVFSQRLHRSKSVDPPESKNT